MNTSSMRQSSAEPSDGAIPPGPRGLPWLGSFYAYYRDPYGFLTDCAREYGAVVQYDMLGTTLYQLNTPAAIEHVLVQNNQNYVKGELFQESLGPVTGNGVLNSNGEQWRRQRHRLDPAFHPDRIAEYAETMVTRTNETISEWRDGETRNIHADAMRITLEIVADALFGVDVTTDVERVGEALSVVMEYEEGFVNSLLPVNIPTLSQRRYENAIEELDRVVYGIIDERQRDPGDDVVSWLIDSTDDAGDPLSRTAIRDEVMTLLLAGHETTALALTFTWYLLSQHPGVEKRLVDELDTVLGGRDPTIEDLDELSYLEQVVNESMRLYPPVPGIIREAVEDDVVEGYAVPAGMPVSINQWTVHRDPRFYDDPLAFSPCRWTHEFKQSLPNIAYFPFSAGPRRCLGDRFAMLEAKLVLATVLQKYHLELISPATLDLILTITARPADPVEMCVHQAE